jgi:hypothetical protein
MKAKKTKRERSPQMQQVSAGLREVLGMTQWRKEHPQATFREIEAAGTADRGGSADGRDRGLEPEAGSGASQVCDLWYAAVGAWGTDPLAANEGRGSDQAEANVWHLLRVWGGLFSPWMRS